MGAAAKINSLETICTLTGRQMDEIVKYVSDSLPGSLTDVSDIDTLMFGNSIRLCVDFRKGLLGELELKAAEILDSDWEVWECDTFVFNQRLHQLVDEYNRQHHESYHQAVDILKDRHNYAHHLHY